jgi:hypothetical protein
MADDGDRIRELKGEIAHLESEVERYRTATEDALQQLDWCIGYFTGSNKRGVAKSLGANRGYIRKQLLNRPELSMPTDTHSAPTDDSH